jgi:hypothetical protein
VREAHELRGGRTAERFLVFPEQPRTAQDVHFFDAAATRASGQAAA